jgi:hypothetical protein
VVGVSGGATGELVPGVDSLGVDVSDGDALGDDVSGELSVPPPQANSENAMQRTRSSASTFFIFHFPSYNLDKIYLHSANGSIRAA